MTTLADRRTSTRLLDVEIVVPVFDEEVDIEPSVRPHQLNPCAAESARSVRS